MATTTAGIRGRIGRGGGFGVAIEQRRFKREIRKIEKALRQLGTEGRARDVVAKTMTPACKPIVQEAKARSPVKSGTYRKSIGRVTKRYPASGTVLGIVGPRTGFKTTINGKPHNPSVIGHLLEFGHGGPRPAPPHPHLRPAYDNNVTRVQRIFATEFWGRYRKKVNSLKAKGKL